MVNKFVHLHVHSEYSLLDGLSSIDRLINKIKELQMDSVAVTDHGAMYGSIEFYKKAQKEGLKPIIGIESYNVNVPHTQRPERSKNKNYHLILLAKNNQGYKNMMKLSSIAHLEGYYYRPRFDKETLKKYSEGLICTTACMQGEIPQSLMGGEYQKAKKVAEWFLDVFGKDFYLEMQRHDFSSFITNVQNDSIKKNLQEMDDQQNIVNEGIVKLSRDLGIPIIATNDAHYIEKDDAEAQDALVCIATAKNVNDLNRMRFIDTPDFYIKSAQEMSDIFSDLPDAISNTIKIAKECNVDITLGKWFFPKYPLPKGVGAVEQLTKLSNDKLKEKLVKPSKEAKDRLNYELDIICSKGYAPYFLIVMDMVNWANSAGIITNTRGSAAGSLVSYVLGITTVNPLEYYLPFERFLNPARPSPPDIDFDVADNRREEVINYIASVYGKEKVAQICTFGRMLARASIRDIARVLGYPYATGDRIAKLIPIGSQGFPMTIQKALDTTAELQAIYKDDADAKKIIDLAKHVEGNARHISVHAAGVVVSPGELTEYTPIQLEPSGDKVITQYEMHACEDVGLIKFDILGIRNLSILGSAIEIVQQTRKKTVDISKIPLDDKKTFEMLSHGETMGTFQLGGSGMTRYLKELKPERVEDLMAMVALYRPGPISQIPEYIARKNNPKLIKYLDPRMKKFLGQSYGLIVYQDDLLFCAIDLAGYTWEEADKFRKAVGKKIPAEMAAQKKKFIEGVINNGQTAKFAQKLWELFEPFQSYGFNKAHAASYGIVAYQTAYMKANYPVEFMTALLTAESDDSEKISQAVNECRRMKIKILPPDINKSDVGFKVANYKKSLDGRAIRFGLSAVKNVGTAAINAILQAREEGKLLSFVDFVSRVDARKVNKKVLESLIKVGALSEFGSRAKLLYSLEDIRSKVANSKSDNSQQGLFSQEEIKKSAMIKSEEIISKLTIEEFSDEEIQNLERQLLGLSLSAKPLNEILGPIEAASTHKIFEISPNQTIGELVKVAAIVSQVRIVVTKRSGAEMAFVKVDDGTGVIDLIVFPKIFNMTRNHWIEYKPLLISGKVDNREETPALIVESIETIEQYLQKDREVFIKIPVNITKFQMNMIKTILLQSKGDYIAYLVFEGKNQRFKLPFKINWNKELAKQITVVIDNTDIS